MERLVAVRGSGKEDWGVTVKWIWVSTQRDKNVLVLDNGHGYKHC